MFMKKPPVEPSTKTPNEVEVFKKPKGIPKKKKTRVLDEESYLEEIGKIIQRDFFPDLEKLKAQNAYLDAMESNDVIKLRQLHQKYSGKKPLTNRIPSPATFETPLIHHTNEVKNDEIIEINENDNVQDKKSLSLDQYLNTHTSQDNESFKEILEESAKKHTQKYSYLYNEEDSFEENQKNMLALPSIEEQAKLPEKKFNIDTWGYKNRNYIMFNPEGVELTKEDEVKIIKNKQEIMHFNTRLTANPFNETQSKEAISEVVKTQAKVLDGKIGVDGKEIMIKTPKINHYTFVQPPSPSLSVLNSPLMTWGEIEGTPFRLDGSDTPIPKTAGPSFKMSEPTRREQLAFELAEKVGEKNRDQKRKNIDAQKRQFSCTPSPRPNSSYIDRLATMSPAAKKLATSKLKLNINSSVCTPTPKHNSMVRSSRELTPKIKRKSCEISTDDLLKIDLPKRQKAQDFF